MATFTWSNVSGGDWSDDGNWNPNGVPGPADMALIELAGQYTVSLDVAEIGSLTLDAAGVTLTPGGTLRLDGSLDVKAGTLTVSHIIQGGTLIADGGTIDYAGGTLDGVTLTGPLDLGGSDASLSIENGITFTGSGPEQIIDTGSYASLQFDDAETLANATITLGNSASYSFLYTGPGLTLAANSTLATEGTAYIVGAHIDNKGSIIAATGTLDDQASITNEGSIALSSGNGLLSYLTNAGTIVVSGTGDSVEITNAVNTGTISVASGAALDTEGTLDNTGGVITLASGTALDLESQETYAQLGTIARHGASLTLGGALDLAGQTLDVSTGGTFDGARITGTITGGTIKMDGGTLSYHAATLDGVALSGPLDLNGDGALALIQNGITFTGNGPGQINDTGAKASLYFNDAETLTNVAISLGNSASYSYLYAGPNLTLAADSTLTTEGAAFINDAGLDNKGSITATTGFLNDSASITNEGLIAISDGYDDNVLSSLTNSGTLTVSGSGTATYTGSVDNTGTITVGSGATLGIGSSSDTLGTISFADDAGTLSLENTNGYRGTLRLFQSGDAIDLAGTGYSLDHTGNTIILSQDGTVVDDLSLTGQDYSDATFTLTTIMPTIFSGMTILTTDAPCFCAGTMILTDRGERPVEELEVGDVVVTRQDGVETSMPIRWAGRRRVVTARHPEPEQVHPIRIMRDAVAPGMPARDLFVSPDHALLLDGMLIQARQLVNHMTVTHDSRRTVVTYHHIELDRHAVLIAEGLPCESYLDGGNRGQFDATGSVVRLHVPTVRDGRTACAPIVTDAAVVRPVWQRLAERARTAGHIAPMPALETAPAPWFETADGVRLASSDGRRFELPPGCSRVRLRSWSDRPTTSAPWSDDRRRLGVAVSALRLRHGDSHESLDLSSLAEDGGWWALERAGNLAWRWTDGDGWIALRQPAEAIEMTLHAVMPATARTARLSRTRTG